MALSKSGGYAAVLLLALLLALTTGTFAQQQSGNAARAARVAWLQEHAIALKSIDPQLGFRLGALGGKNLLPSPRICGTAGFPSMACGRLYPREPA